MSMTLKNLQGKIDRTISNYASEGEKTQKELEILSASIVDPLLPSDAVNLSKLLYENPGLLSDDSILQALKNNLRRVLINSGVESYNLTIAEITEARADYERR